jgi:hypothetical protein
MKFFGQTTPDTLEERCFAMGQHTHTEEGHVVNHPHHNEEYVYVGLRQYFWAPVAIAVDNTMHIVLMWILFSVFGAAV